MTPDFESTPPPSQALPSGATGRPSRRRLQSLFWPGFAAGFLLLSALSCGGLAVATGLNRIDLADIQGNGNGWAPPTVTITPLAQPATDSASPVAEDGAFALGESVRNITNSRVNIRQTPGYLGKTPTDVVGQLDPGDNLEIVAGPAPADNLRWWLIRAERGDGRVIEGWVAEVTASGVQILGR